MQSAPFLLHALSPLHAGTGHAADIIDLPTARMKATGIPFVPGSSIKGVLRDARRADALGPDPRVEAVFGPSDDPGAHAGALVVGEARLLALPVRTFKAAFAWVTSPLLLALAARDLGAAVPVPAVGERGARVPPGSACVHLDRLYLEDLDLPVEVSKDVEEWARLLAPHASPVTDIFTSRLAVVDDDTMAFLWDTATQVDARVRLGADTRTVAPGALWFEESLPPETLLVGLLAADRSRRSGVTMAPEEVLAFAVRDEEVLQFGGKATTGRGRCRMVRLSLVPVEVGSGAR
jgi:CRISPR-associated protein Cmr4